MQRISLALNIILTIAVGILFFIVLGNKNQEEDTAPKLISNRQLAKIKNGSKSIVYVNMDSLYSKYEYVNELKGKLEQTQKTKQKELENQYMALEREVAAFREIAQRLSQEEGEKQQAALMQKEQNLMQLREKLAADLYNSEQEMNEQLSQKITQYLHKYKKQVMYDFVLSYTKGGGILYTNDSLDITPSVIEGLNKDYKLEKETEKK
jgi:outer membrane protein